jgi:hypothetical protein
MTHATWYDGCPPGWIPGQAVLAGIQGTPNRKTTTLSRARSGGTRQVDDMVDTTTFTAEVQRPPSILLYNGELSSNADHGEPRRVSHPLSDS